MRRYSNNRTKSLDRERQMCVEMKHGAFTKVVRNSTIERSDSVFNLYYLGVIAYSGKLTKG